MRLMRSSIRWTVLASILLIGTSGVSFAEYELGMTYFKQGKFVESAAEWEDVITNAPDYDWGYFMLGNCYAKLKKYADAEIQYRKAVEFNPSRFEYHMNLGLMLLNTKKYDEVVVSLDKAEELASKASETKRLRRTRGLALARVRDYDRAIDDLNQVDPASDHYVALELGRACFAIGDNACVDEALGQALAQKPDDTVALEILTKSQIETARRAGAKSAKSAAYKKAIGTARKLTDLSGSSVEAHELLGAALLGGDDFKGAVTEYETVLKLQPKNCNAMLNIGQAKAKLEAWDDMLSYSKRAASCDPKNHLSFTQQAFVYNKTKRWDSATEAATKALGLKETSSAKEQLRVAKDGKEAEAQNARREKELELLDAERKAEAERQAEEERRRREYAIRTGQDVDEGGSSGDDGGADSGDDGDD